MERVSVLMGSRLFASVIPVTLAFLGVLIANLPVSFLGGIVPAPLLGLMPIYFWGLVRPDLMPPFWAFAAGVLEDMLSGGPAGVWTVSFIVTYALIDRQRDAFAGLSGFGAILGFATAASLACASAYTVVALYHWHLPPFAPVMGELAMSIVFYVPALVFLGFVHRRLVGPLRSDF
jgi:cell shape-determining protein MreD